MPTLAPFPRLAEEISAFNARGQLGKDPVAACFAERRKAHGLFTNLLTDRELDLLKPYLFCWRESAAAELGRPGPGHQLHRRRVAAPGQGRDGPPPQPRRPAHPADGGARLDRGGRGEGGERRRPGLEVTVVGGGRVHLPQARHQELQPDDGLLLRGLHAGDPPANPQDPARGAEGLLRGQARRGPPRGLGRGRAPGRAAPADAPGPQLLAQPVGAGRGVGHHLADELHLGHPRHPPRRGVPGGRAVHLQGAPLRRDHQHHDDPDDDRRRRRPGLRPEGRGVRQGHRQPGDGPAGDGGGGDRLVRDGEQDPAGPRAEPAAVRGRRLQLVLRGRRLLARGAQEDRRPARLLGLWLRGAQVHVAARRAPPPARRSIPSSGSSTRRWGPGGSRTRARRPTTRS